MKIAVLSDIHGNSVALKAVLNEAKQENIQKLLILGDLVGYYYSPDEVLEMLSYWSSVMIKGNHEKLLLDLYSTGINSDFLSYKYGKSHEISLKKLSRNQILFLKNLPERRTIKINSVSFQLNHGSPWDNECYLYPDSPIELFERCNSDEHDFVLIGHSHYSFSYKCKSSILINAGSVGQSREKGGVATWAIINTSDKSFAIKGTKYDIKSLLFEVETYDPNILYNKTILLRK
jgi:putative phosphoesterase